MKIKIPSHRDIGAFAARDAEKPRAAAAASSNTAFPISDKASSSWQAPISPNHKTSFLFGVSPTTGFFLVSCSSRGTSCDGHQKRREEKKGKKEGGKRKRKKKKGRT